MKKSILILSLVLTFSFILGVSSLAYDNTLTLSEDYSTLYFNGKSYSKADTADTENSINNSGYIEGRFYVANFVQEAQSPVIYEDGIKIQLTDSQKSELTKVYATVGGDDLFASAELNFKDGKTIWYSYVRDDIKDDYEKTKNSDAAEYKINFDAYIDEGNILKTVSKQNLLTGNKTEVSIYEYLEFDVIVSSSKYNYSVTKGCIYVNDEKNLYYYIDFSETGVTDKYDLYDMCEFYNVTRIEAHRITDEKTIALIEEGIQEYYDGDYGYLFNEEFTEPVAKIFFILVFALFPLAIAVTTLVIAIKSKKSLYKKLLLITSAISVAEIITFIYIAFTLFNN